MTKATRPAGLSQDSGDCHIARMLAQHGGANQKAKQDGTPLLHGKFCILLLHVLLSGKILSCMALSIPDKTEESKRAASILHPLSFIERQRHTCKGHPHCRAADVLPIGQEILNLCLLLA